MANKKHKLAPAEQRKRFIEAARELQADETEQGQERAFCKVGLKKAAQRKGGRAAR